MLWGQHYPHYYYISIDYVHQSHTQKRAQIQDIEHLYLFTTKAYSLQMQVTTNINNLKPVKAVLEKHLLLQN